MARTGVDGVFNKFFYDACRALNHLAGRDHCIPDDVVGNVLPVCAHRVVSRTYMHQGDVQTTRRILQQVLEQVASPA